MIDYSQVVVQYGTPATDVTLLDLTKRLMDVQSCSGQRDDELTLYIQMAGEAAERYCENVLAQQAVTELVPHEKSQHLLIYFPYFDGLTVDVGGEDVTADYEVMRDGKLAYAVKERCYFTQSSCYEQMTLTYNAGYDPLPAELGYVIARAAIAYDEQGDSTGPVRRETVAGVGTIEYETSGAESITNFGTFNAASITVLDKYKRVPV